MNVAPDNKNRTSSFFNMSTRRQLCISALLMTVIPVLAAFHLGSSWGAASGGVSVSFLIAIIMTLGSAASGFLIVKKYPRNIEQLRRYVEQLTSGEFPEQINLLKTNESCDLAYIEKGFNTVLLDLIKTEHHRTMVESLATLCRYIQKPATSLEQYMQTLSGQTESRFDRELINECMNHVRYIHNAVDMIYSSKEFKDAEFNPDDCKIHGYFPQLADLVICGPHDDCATQEECPFSRVRSLPLKERLHAAHNMPADEAKTLIMIHSKCSEKKELVQKKSA